MARRLERDLRGDRHVGRLRLVAAVVCAVAALWLLVLTELAWPAIVVAAAVAIAVRFWARSWAQIERARSGPAAAVLLLDDDALRLGERALPWTDVARVELDQDRLLVRVVPTSGAPLELEPPWGGLGLDALGAAVEDARRAARARASASPD